MSKYSGFEGIAAFSFVLFALSWVLLRLIYYPFWILWSTRFVYILQLLYLECFLLDLCLIRCWWVAAIRLLWLWTRKSTQSKDRSTTTCSTLSCFVCLCFTYSGGFWFTGCLWSKYRIEASLAKMSDPVCLVKILFDYVWYACFGWLTKFVYVFLQILKVMMNMKIDCYFGTLCFYKQRTFRLHFIIFLVVC